MLTLKPTPRFRRDVKKAQKRGLNIAKLDDVILTLLELRPLPPARRDHALDGDYAGYRECHIEPDWLLVYRVIDDELILVAYRTGTHADLFD
jgi:mRNA interferase YafQ